MADIFQEVDEIMRQERIAKFWKENGAWIIGFIVLTIAFTAGLSTYRQWNASDQEKQTASVIEAIESPEFPHNIKELSQELRPGLKSIALLTAAGSYKNKELYTKAATLYEILYQDKSIKPEYRDLAAVLASQSRFLAKDENTDLKQAEENLKKVAQNERSPWRYHANLELALHYADMQDYSRAQKHLKLVKEAKNIPANMKNKATSLSHLYELQAAQNSANNEKEEG